MAETLPNPFGWQSNNNDRYLRFRGGVVGRDDGNLDFTGPDPYIVFTAERSTNANPRYMNIKHCRTKLYLRRAPNQLESPFLIVATAKTPNENTSDPDCTLFELCEVRKVGPTNDTPVVRVRHVQSNCYLRRHNFPNFDAALGAVSTDDDSGEVDLFTIIKS